MTNLIPPSPARLSAADELFLILRQFLNNEKIQKDELPDDRTELMRLFEIHSLQPIFYYMIAPPNSALPQQLSEWEQKLWSRYISSAYIAAQQDMDAEEMAAAFQANNIPLVFFKGVVLRTFYPEPQLRTMSDIDCLVQRKDRERAHSLMLNLGYTCQTDKGDVWVYCKESTSVEMHTFIAQNSFRNNFDYRNFFADAAEHMEKMGNFNILKKEYHFCFLIYHIAKHLNSTGAGIRMILDIVVFLRHYENEFDWAQAEKLLRKARLDKAAGAVFQLCARWFGTGIPWKKQVREEVLEQLEAYITDGGTFGFETHDIGDMYLRRGYGNWQSRGRYRFYCRLLRNYLFPSGENMLQIMPALEQKKWLLPAAWVKRWWLGAFRRRQHSLHTVRSMLKDDGGRGQREQEMLKALGL